MGFNILIAIAANSKMESISDLDIDLPWLRIMGTAKSRAVIEQEPAIRQIQRCHRQRYVLAYRFADRKIEGRVFLQMCRTVAGAVRESGTVVHVASGESSPRQIEVEAGVQSMPLIVIQEKIAAGRRREISQPPANGACSFGVCIGVAEVHFTMMRNLRRANCNLPPVQSRSINRQREENVRVADRIVIELIARPLVVVVHLKSPTPYRNRNSELMFLIPLAAKRDESKTLGAADKAANLER
jgi:hypothetical protein